MREGKRLLWFEKFMFARHLRNGPPYTEVPVSAYTPAAAVPAPPTYDPYVQGLPVYQKEQTQTYEMDVTRPQAAYPATRVN